MMTIRMTKDIISKLRDHLSRPINTECAVVYLLAEVRKILDKVQQEPKPFALWMYCHWALHVDLTHSRTTLTFLKPVDDFIVNTVAGFEPDDSYQMLDSHRLFCDLIFLDTFRSQLRQFLQDHDHLPTELCDRDDWWFPFLSAYAGVIEDGALSSETAKNDGLRAIEKVVFSKGRMPIAADGLFDFIVQWDVVLKDGRVCRGGFEAKPDRKMVFWGFHLQIQPGFPPIRQAP